MCSDIIPSLRPPEPQDNKNHCYYCGRRLNQDDDPTTREVLPQVCTECQEEDTR